MLKVKSKAIWVLIAAIVVAGSVIVTRNTLVKKNELTGVVTSKFTDCEGGIELDEQGRAVPIKQVSCDGGSYITIDRGQSFITSTGRVPPDLAYSVDVTKIKVGDRVTVRYIKDSEGNKKLNCDRCGVTRQN